MALTLIVDDDKDAAQMLAALIRAQGHSAAVAHTLGDARRLMVLQSPDLVLLDLRLPDGNGLSLFGGESLLANSEVVLVTGHASIETSIEALRLGAADYLVKPVTLNQLQGVLSRVMRPSVLAAELQDWRDNLQETGRFGHLVGRSARMQQVYQQIARVAGTAVTAFIMGESGTGKELVAQTLHDFSRRRSQIFLPVNCGAISPTLMESEIFGHEKGSFTGADRLHLGFFERAHGGTLFLDEITEMPMDLQVKLLRVLETGTFMRVGSTHLRDTDVRIIAASNRDPLKAVAQGSLREDLLYRLNVFPIMVPPLRSRLEDLDLLSDHILQDIGKREGQLKWLLPEARDKLREYQWPGNVRELRNVLQRIYVMTESEELTAQWLPRNAGEGSPHDRRTKELNPSNGTNAPGDTNALHFSVGRSLASVEQQLVVETLKHFENNKEKTAAALGVSVKTLYNKLKAYESGSYTET